ncbi:hypothetical protein C5167_042316 [Papaver somniferum]|uniref:Expansin n=1 Tax=Papaver somniferum TaxID=3469 RepID=A0A4Y7L2H2_PAPSO|nr:expansin-A1-like [Papaver somniferum]RZC79743.1 hypothetical protein C5167_042316 [Papaver somniferum]
MVCSKHLIWLLIAITWFSSKLSEGREYPWTKAHATFYGDSSGSETMQGACGYGNLFQQGYGLETAALSTALFNGGLTCGACFEIRCYNSAQWCLKGSVRVTATNFCPPNYSLPNDNGGWCNPPRKHFDLSLPMFLKIAQYRAGIVPVLFRRIPCLKQGGIKFEIKGNPYWMLVLVYNVGGTGNVVDVKVKGSKTNEWVQMSRNWGQNWQTSEQLLGQSLSFRVTTQGGRTVQSDNVAPANWEFGKTYEGRNNIGSV